jgi:hypothetical protein
LPEGEENSLPIFACFALESRNQGDQCRKMPMPDYTDDDALDDEYSMMQDDQDESDNSDNFDNFDPARYLRKRRGERTYDNAEAEADVAGDGELPGYRARRSGAVGSRSRERSAFDPTVDRDQGVLRLLLGGLGPNLRVIVLSLGCFVILLCIGACGLAILAVNALTSR